MIYSRTLGAGVELCNGEVGVVQGNHLTKAHAPRIAPARAETLISRREPSKNPSQCVLVNDQTLVPPPGAYTMLREGSLKR